jgi:PKHD-type hydroxylase
MHPFCQWNQALSPEECDEIIKVGNSKIPNKATVNATEEEVVNKIRRSKVSWLSEMDIPWLYSRIEYIAQQLNGQFFDFDLWGLHEDLQYTVYESDDEGFYNWHVDAYTTIDENNIDQRLPRKMSLSFQLSDPSDYEGGDLLITDGEAQKLPRDRGLALAFPSYLMHTVTPVTKGVRRSLVVWVTGPRFK